MGHVGGRGHRLRGLSPRACSMLRAMRRTLRLALICAPLSLTPACEEGFRARRVPSPVPARRPIPAEALQASPLRQRRAQDRPSPKQESDAEVENGPEIVVPTHDERESEPETTPEPTTEAGPEASPEPSAQAEPAKTEATAKLELPAPMFPKVREGCGGAPGVGQKVKGFKLKSTSGKTIAPSYYRGRVVLLNFWGTWCKPCLKELPEFSRLYRRYRKLRADPGRRGHRRRCAGGGRPHQRKEDLGESCDRRRSHGGGVRRPKLPLHLRGRRKRCHSRGLRWLQRGDVLGRSSGISENSSRNETSSGGGS